MNSLKEFLSAPKNEEEKAIAELEKLAMENLKSQYIHYHEDSSEDLTFSIPIAQLLMDIGGESLISKIYEKFDEIFEKSGLHKFYCVESCGPVLAVECSSTKYDQMDEEEFSEDDNVLEFDQND